MKNLLFYIVVTAIMLPSATANGQPKDSRTVQITEAYDAVVVTGPHSLNFQTGPAGEPLTVLGTDEEFGRVNIFVRHNTLYIENRHESNLNRKNIKGVRVFARNPELKKAEVRGSARIDISGVQDKGSNIFKVTGSGKIEVAAIDCTDVEISVTGSGSFRCPSVKARSLNAHATGSGKLDFSGEITDLNIIRTGSGKVNIGRVTAANVYLKGSGTGNITARGTAESLEAVQNSSGKLDASGLKARTAEVRLGGSGKIHVYCTDELEAATSGSGKIYYSGNPQTVKGNGKVKNLIQK